MNTHPTTPNTRTRGFSLVEMLASVTIIGIIAFLAIPSVTKMREDSEKNLGIARVEALNVAIATLVQVRGRTQAATDWANATTNETKYDLLEPYLSFSETTLSAFLPSGYSASFYPSILEMKKTRLFGPDSAEIKY
jgi:prepilin-type N-terminal cleavage/methylation domain-containing protein